MKIHYEDAELDSMSWKLREMTGSRICALALLGVLAVSSGCSSIIDSASQKRSYMQSYAAGDFERAASLSADKASSRADTGDGLMWLLEAGKSSFSKGDYQASLSYFDAAEHMVEDFDRRAVVSARDVAAEAASATTNPNAIPYRGSYVDREMLNVYKALIYFALGKPEDACVELKRMHERQKKSMDGRESEIKAADDLANQNKINVGTMSAGSPELSKANGELNAHAYKTYANYMNPFCSYLSSIGYLWRGDVNEAMVDFRNLREMDPANPLINADYVSLGRQVNEKIPAELANVKPYSHSLTKGVVFIIVENGLVPSRRGVTVHMVLPPPVGYTGFAFPVLDFTSAPLHRVDWSDNVGNSGCTFRVSDMDAVAAYEFKDAMKPMLVRVIIGTLIKEGATVAAYEVVRHQYKNDRYNGNGNFAGFLVLMASGLYKYTFNTADTRSWQTLPKEFQAANLPMPADGVLRLGFDGGPVRNVFQLDTSKKMAIVYVQSPGNGVFSVKVFQFD